MEAYVKKCDYNYIKKLLFGLKGAMAFSTDPKVIAFNKLVIKDKINALIKEVPKETKALFNIEQIEEPSQIETYLEAISPYVYGMPTIAPSQIKKLFKKEKKIRLPKKTLQENAHVYLGWRDEGAKKLYVIYALEDSFYGMVCRVEQTNMYANHVCAFCNRASNQGDIAFVSPICKTSSAINYKSIGFSMCLDSEKCNNRIIDVEKLESIIRKVNNLPNFPTST